MARAGDFRVDVSEPIISEVIAVLREDFHWEPYRLHDARQRITALGNLVTPMETVEAVKDDPDDNRVLECAVEAGSDCIVTRDKDLLRLAEYEGISIVTPSQFLEPGRER
jgi:predicted nucleic acid-binding protein